MARMNGDYRARGRVHDMRPGNAKTKQPMSTMASRAGAAKPQPRTGGLKSMMSKAVAAQQAAAPATPATPAPARGLAGMMSSAVQAATATPATPVVPTPPPTAPAAPAQLAAPAPPTAGRPSTSGFRSRR